MSPRLIAALLAAVLLAPAARAAPEIAPKSACIASLLPFDWFASPMAGDPWGGAHTGPTAYSYLPGRTSAPHLGPLRLSQAAFGSVQGPVGAVAVEKEKTYTIVERAGHERFRPPLPTAAVLFASAMCGIGGLAWWRCQSRGAA